MRRTGQKSEVRSQKLKQNNSAFGFTLIEVIVAIAILSISFVLVMQLFSNGLKAARSSCDYTRAIVLAKDKLDELSGIPVSGSGEFEEGFTWESEVEPYGEDEESGYNLLKVKVIVSWDSTLNRQRSVELVTLRMSSDEEEL